MNGGAADTLHARWWPTVAGISLLMIATLGLYRNTALGMVALWSSAETFAHGFIVPLISLWLLWRKRKTLIALAPNFAPAWSALPFVAAAGLVWLVGDVAAVNAASQFALVALLVLCVPAVAGWPATRAVLFPLGFLFFAVPFGDFLLPVLMARTADFTVMALRATGIPVYRDGLQFVIPSGTWSVVEACSGVRYLLASLMVGALFAYLNYRTTKRRMLFMLVAIAVPIVANWLRAYMIVMIGHLSGNQLAVGVDHLIYGWVFFGLVIGAMFMIGARWSEPPADEPLPATPASATAQRGAVGPVWAAAAGMAALLALPLYTLQALTSAEDRSAPRLAEPAFTGIALAEAGALPAWTPAFGNPAATLERTYRFNGRPVGLYVGYFRAQGPTSKLVSSTNALVRSSDAKWIQPEAGSRSVALTDGSVVVKTARLRRPVASSDNMSLVAWQVYWVNGRFEASDARAKAWGAWYRLLGRGDDGAVLVVYAQESKPGDADLLLEGFLRDYIVAIESQLRKARDGD